MSLLDQFRVMRLEGEWEMGSTHTLSDLLETKEVHFLLVEWPVRDIPETAPPDPFWCDLTRGRHLNAVADSGQPHEDSVPSALLKRLSEGLENAGDRALICLLPTCSDAQRNQELFGKIRSRYFGIHSPSLSHGVILVVDFPTWRASHVETGLQSTLGKEIGQRVWVVDDYGEQDPATHWLTGGDPDLTRALQPMLGEAPNDNPGQRPREATHQLVTWLLEDSRPGSIESRLRRTMAAPAAPQPLDNEDRYHRDDLCSRLKSLLPRVLPANNECIDYQLEKDELNRTRARSVWNGLSAADSTLAEKGLLAANLLGFSPDPEGSGYYLRIRSPLFAYAVGQRAYSRGLWEPGQASKLAKFFSRHPQALNAREKETGLDLYLDWLLDLASCDGQDPRSWLVPPLRDRRPGPAGRAQEWWKRIIAEEQADV